MTSDTTGLGELSPKVAQREVMKGQKDFYRSLVNNGFAETINSVVSAEPVICNNDLALQSMESVEGATIDELVEAAYKEDPSCRKVFTGNKGNYSYPNKAYARTFAYSMAQDMCAEGPIKEVFSMPPLGRKDALSLEPFKKSAACSDHFVATYALAFSLGQRESNGNFSLGRDVSASNTGVAEEAGLTQTSPNSLNLKGEKGTPSEYLLRNIFQSYVTSLPQMDQQQKASFCLSDKLTNSNQNRNFDTSGGKLHDLFESGTCNGIDQVTKSITFAVTRTTHRLNECFKKLHQNCPGFSIKYGAAVARIRRNHHGPLILREEFNKNAAAKFFKPYVRPACHVLFNSIAANKEKICKDMNQTPASPLAEAYGKFKGTDYLAPNSDSEIENPFSFESSSPGALLRGSSSSQ